MYTIIIQLCRQQTKVTHSYANMTVHNIGQGGAIHRKQNQLKVDDGQGYGRSCD